MPTTGKFLGVEYTLKSFDERFFRQFESAVMTEWERSGVKSAVELGEAVERITGLTIDRDALYDIARELKRMDKEKEKSELQTIIARLETKPCIRCKSIEIEYISSVLDKSGLFPLGKGKFWKGFRRIYCKCKKCQQRQIVRIPWKHEKTTATVEPIEETTLLVDPEEEPKEEASNAED